MIAIILISFFAMGFFFKNAIETVHQGFDFYGHSARDLALAIVLAWSAFLLSSCTMAPREVTSATIAPSGTHQDAGIVDWAFDAQGHVSGAYVRQDYVDNYRAMIKAYGSKLVPAVTAPRSVKATDSPGICLADLQTVSQYAQLIGLEINGP